MASCRQQDTAQAQSPINSHKMVYVCIITRPNVGMHVLSCQCIWMWQNIYIQKNPSRPTRFRLPTVTDNWHLQMKYVWTLFGALVMTPAMLQHLTQKVCTNSDESSWISYDLLDVGSSGSNDGTNGSAWNTDLTDIAWMARRDATLRCWTRCPTISVLHKIQLNEIS